MSGTNGDGAMSNERRSRQPFVLLCLAIAGAIAVVTPVAVSAQSTTDDPAQLDAGQVVFETSCAGCHGVDGTGTNTGRPLTGIANDEPDRLVHIESVTMGKGGMPAFESELSGDEIDAAVTYVRLSFSGSGTLQELPRTGTSPELLMAAGFLLVAGFALNETARRRRPVLG